MTARPPSTINRRPPKKKLLAYLNKKEIEAGCDEAGRGCLAGPVFAAAVILPKGFKNKLLNDSKQISEKHRDQLRIVIEREALAWAVAKVDAHEIDEINILNASFLAMHRAVSALNKTPTSLLIDGNRFTPYGNLPHHCIIKGDGKFMPIAAASILAKTHRDEFMYQLAETYPQYGWLTNKAYPTKAHRAAIAKYGITPYHRKSFRLLPDVEQGKLF
jgi:ribonuclease HII